MAAFNAAPFIRAAIDSILGQTYADFELLVVDDASTDDTARIASGYGDPRVRVISAPEHLGVVGIRNLGFEHARGEYLAVHDADDISHPTRFARQVHHLDTHPGTVLIATEIRRLHPGGKLTYARHREVVTPLQVDWILNIGNPIAFSSTMLRMSAARKLDRFLREERRYAEDFDLYTRLRQHGTLSKMACPLLVYRIYPNNTSSQNRSRMIASASEVVIDFWRHNRLAVDDPSRSAALIANHIAGSEPIRDRATLRELRDLLELLATQFLVRHASCDPRDREAIVRFTNNKWEDALRSSLGVGVFSWPWQKLPCTQGTQIRFDMIGPMRALARGVLARCARMIRGRRTTISSDKTASSTGGCPSTHAAFDTPTLFVSVIVEGGDETAGSGATSHTAFALLAQALFDKYGLRPTYFLDDAALSNPATLSALVHLRNEGKCTLGIVSAASATTKPVCGSAYASAFWPGASTDGAAASDIARANGIPATPIPSPTSELTPTSRQAGSRRQRLRARLKDFAAYRIGPDISNPVSLVANDHVARKQIALIRNMLDRGLLQFSARVTLRQGQSCNHAVMDNLRQVCTFFFDDLGGLPGDSRKVFPECPRHPNPDAWFA